MADFATSVMNEEILQLCIELEALVPSLCHASYWVPCKSDANGPRQGLLFLTGYITRYGMLEVHSLAAAALQVPAGSLVAAWICNEVVPSRCVSAVQKQSKHALGGIILWSFSMNNSWADMIFC